MVKFLKKGVSVEEAQTQDAKVIVRPSSVVYHDDVLYVANENDDIITFK